MYYEDRYIYQVYMPKYTHLYIHQYTNRSDKRMYIRLQCNDCICNLNALITLNDTFYLDTT